MKRVTVFLTLILALILSSSFEAEGKLLSKKKKKKGKETTEVEKKKSEYEKFFDKDKDMEKVNGFIKLYKSKGKLYFEVSNQILEREMLLGSTVTEISDNQNAIVGSKPTTPLHFKFSKINNTVGMRLMTNKSLASENDQNINRSLSKSTVAPIYELFKIEAYNEDSTSYIFDVTDLFLSDKTELSPFDPLSENLSNPKTKRDVKFQKSMSYIGSIKGFSDNISILSTLSYTFSLSGGSAKVKNKPFTAVMTRSIMLLDETPYRPRITDSRIAIFPTGKYYYNSDQQRVKAIWYAKRWRLEPSNMTAYSKGELVDPVKPIIFYIDPDFPTKWRSYIKEGVNQWSEIFEEIGFKNAVVARDYPTAEEDPEFDPDNIKYSCVRYAPIPVKNAMGPSWVDPRSGEIISASVYLFHDAINLVNNWLFVQTAAADKRVREVIIPEEIIGDGLRYVVSHEIGHCLGFMHNMGASAVIPVDSLRSPTFTKEHGTTYSIMDYARFNYVAQPGDVEKGVKLTPPRFGLYDKFLVKWNYTPLPNTKDEFEEYKITSKWIREASSNPIYRYGEQQVEDIIDPRSLSEDLGDDAMKASEYGIKNLKYILANMNNWLSDKDKDYSYRKNIYDEIIMQYHQYMIHVYANIGGVHLYKKHVGDQVQRFQSVPREKQKRAVRFLLNMISDLDWIDNKELMENLTLMGSPADALRGRAMQAVLSAPVKVEFSALKAEGKAYSVKECLDDIFNYVWESTIKGKALTKTEQKIQRLFLDNLGNSVGVRIGGLVSAITYDLNLPEMLSKESISLKLLCNNRGVEANAANYGNIPVSGYNSSGIRYEYKQNFEAVYFGYLLKVRDLLKRNTSHYDKESRLHYQLLLHYIDKALK